jgi:hypothetical protein
LATFNSIADLEKWVKTSNGQNSVLNESQIRQSLTQAGQQLQKLIIAELNAYFQSYDPVVYDRTGNTVDSIRVGKPRKISINEWALDITFDESLANHRSYIGNDQPDGYTPWLLQAGWRTRLDSTVDIENFTRFKGTNYLTKAVNKFNQTNQLGLKVQVFHGNQDVTGKYFRYGE